MEAVAESALAFYVVLELAEGGDLHTRLKNSKGPIGERLAKIYFLQVGFAVSRRRFLAVSLTCQGGIDTWSSIASILSSKTAFYLSVNFQRIEGQVVESLTIAPTYSLSSG